MNKVKISIMPLIFFILILIFSCKSEREKKSSINNSDNKKQNNPEVLKKAEGINKKGKDQNTTVELFENEDNYIEVTTINNISLKGEIVAVGDAMFNELVLTTEDGKTYTFKPEYKDQYWKYQGKTISITGKVEERVVTNKKTGKVLKKNWLYPIKILK